MVDTVEYNKVCMFVFSSSTVISTHSSPLIEVDTFSSKRYKKQCRFSSPGGILQTGLRADVL